MEAAEVELPRARPQGAVRPAIRSEVLPIMKWRPSTSERRIPWRDFPQERRSFPDLHVLLPERT